MEVARRDEQPGQENHGGMIWACDFYMAQLYCFNP